MIFSKKISWEQGLFLQPQHFQVADIQKDILLYKYLGLLRDNLWGSDDLVLDPVALQEDKVVISAGKAIFKDGSLVEVGKNAVTVSRAFTQSWTDRSKDLDIYIALKKIDMQGSNVTTVESENITGSISTRFISLEQPEAVKDFYHTGPNAYIKTQSYFLNIMWGEEIAEANDYEILHIAKIVQHGDKISCSAKYIPPCLKLDSYAHLYDLIRSIRDNLSTRAKQLAIYKLQSDIEDIAIQNRRWLNLLALQVFNRYISLLTELLTIKTKSPNEAFAVLSQLINELKTFSEDTVVLNINLDAIDAISYNHDDLFGSFNTTRELIFKLCDNITFTPSQIFPLHYVNGIFSVDLPLSIFTARTTYYIKVSLEDGNNDKLRNIAFQSQIKIGSITTITNIVERSLDGIPFEILPSTPAGVPADTGSVYIRLDSTAEAWRDIVSSLSIALFWNDRLDQVQFDFICVRS